MIKFLILHFISFHLTQGILRNPVSDRCIHIGYKHGELTSYADQCSLVGPRMGENGNPDQWVEVVRRPERIQKSDTLLCLHSTADSEVSVGDCDSKNSLLTFTKIYNNSYEYAIKAHKSLKCLTINSGTVKLTFEECNVSNRFQRWIACRNMEMCDVEIHWSPAQIIFPNQTILINETNISNDKTSSLPMKMTTTVSSLTTAEMSRFVINEVLYYLHNALKLKKPEEVTEIIEDFYSFEEISNALDIIRTYFSPEIDPRLGTMKKGQVKELVEAMKLVLTMGDENDVIFVSENLSRVPNQKQGCPSISLEGIKVGIEKDFKEFVDQLDRFRQKVFLKLDALEVSSESEFGVVDLIDLRNGMGFKSVKI